MSFRPGRLLRISLLATVVVASTGVYAGRETITLTGVVVEDHSGAPMATQALRIRRAGDATALADLVTDAEGRFNAPALPAGLYDISIEGPAFTPMNVRVAAPPVAPLHLRAFRYGVVGGQLLPQAGGSLVLIEQTPDGVTPRTIRATPDASGAFRFWPVAHARYVLGLQHPASGAQRSVGLMLQPDGAPPRVFAIGAGEAIEDVVIPPPVLVTGSLGGRVAAAEGEIAGAVSVRIARADLPSFPFWTRLIPRTREFRVDDLLYGDYLVAAESVQGRGPELEHRGRATVTVGAASAEVEVRTRTGVAQPLAISRKPPAPASLTVVVDANTAADTAVVLVDLTPGRAGRVDVRVARPGAELTFESLPPGRYVLVARPAAGGDARWWPEPDDAIELPAGESRRVVLRW